MYYRVTLFLAATTLCTLVFSLTPVVHLVSEFSHGLIHTLATTERNHTRTLAPEQVSFTTVQSGETYDSIVFTGDVLLARNVEHLMDRFGHDYPFSGLDLTSFGSNPAVVGNFESSVPPTHVPTPAFTLNFSTATSVLPAMGEAGFSHVSLANNHTKDFGVPAFIHTIEVLYDNQLRPFGYSPSVTYDDIAFLQTAYGTVAVLGFDDTMKPLKAGMVEEQLRFAAAQSDFQVAFIHWGIEYDDTSSDRQRKLAKELVQAGADLIVGHHPHVVQEIGNIEGVPVIYSLGNYIFDQYFSTEVQEGLVATLTFEPEPHLTLHPVTSHIKLSQPQLLTGDTKASYLYQLSRRSDPSYRQTLVRGRVNLDLHFANPSKIAMIAK